MVGTCDNEGFGDADSAAFCFFDRFGNPFFRSRDNNLSRRVVVCDVDITIGCELLDSFFASCSQAFLVPQ